jgi:tRNA(Ile)-lysidine synthase
VPHSSAPHHFRSRFEQFIEAQHLIEAHETTLLAVSGGVDSVVMVDLFASSHKPFAIAHCNFGLRAAASEEDEAFVTQLAAAYNVQLYVAHFSTQAYAAENQLSIQIAARQLRYTWFKELCAQHQLQKLATAHHVNDMVETLLFNLIKGTGIAGLHGILPKKESLIRPLLFATKAEILAYAQASNLHWREDSSNASNAYARNLIRNRVIPILKSINPNLEKTTSATIQRMGQVEVWFQEQLKVLQKTIISHVKGITYVDIQALADKPWAIMALWELLKPFGFNFRQIQTLWHVSDCSGKRITSTTHQLYVDRGAWLLRPHPTKTIPAHLYSVDQSDTQLHLGSYNLHFAISPLPQYCITAAPNIAALDMDTLKFPLVVRPWQAGDYFYPIGMQHRKKVSDLLIDQKVNVIEKAKVQVLLSNGDIAWVIGHRIDNRFKVTPATTQVYEVKQIAH